MNKKDIKTIIVALAISIGVYLAINLIQTILDFSVNLRLSEPLNEYILWGYSPMILSGLYIGNSKTTKKVAIGLIVGLMFELSLWLLIGLLIPLLVAVPYFNTEFKIKAFSIGVASSSLMCAFIAWVAHKLLQKRRGKVTS